MKGRSGSAPEYAKYNDMEIVGQYIDRAYSAKTDNRPDFQRMIKDSYRKQFDIVLVWKLDRFARDRFDSAYYKRILKKKRRARHLCQGDDFPGSRGHFA